MLAKKSPAANPENIGKTNILLPVEYGQGVYYFPCVAAEFANSLATFIKQHPELEITSIAPDDKGERKMQNGGYISGYFVVCKRKKIGDDFLP
ncbi:hypothetical protein HZB94_01370 [Candidatus Falkowbacteria bacterium]|nr:hypothetical protein [Candidatus Falkowbacteria bacterium]